ncbi:histidine kinase [Massilia sp. YIM B02769]|uniref:sensor histidine kinase n=1 Tax=unclassified Massilia TaxID=2609279 RepID=UPI0025B72D1C|nr:MULTISPECIES: histidine kinase [unclassified Massilia]MDN4057569.1 histidine kinase [Massilia sp. YIM B02769]
MSWLQSIVFPLLPSFARTPSRPASAATAAASPDAEAWMVFGMRLLLAVSAVLTLHIGADSVRLPGKWSWLIFVAYVAHSLTLLVVARSRAGFWHGPVIYWVDIGWYGLMVYASGGAPSPFFSFFFFAILAASFRHGFDAGARLTLGAVAVVAVAVLSTQGTHTLHLLLLRSTFLLALGYMIAFWGGLSVDQRRRLALLRDVSRLSNPRFGVQHTLDSLMAKILRFYGGSTCVLLMEDPQGGWILNTVHHPRSGRAVSRLHVDEAAVAPLLAPGGGAVLYRGEGRLRMPGTARAETLAPDAGAWAGMDMDTCVQIADLLDTGAFISASLPLRKGSGRIFVTSAPGLKRADATFLNHIAQQAFPVIETIDLLDRLASDAAFRERQTIARDLHDSTIQPYIGLRHAVAAIRQQAGDDNTVAPDLERLMAMCSGVIGDMREFAQRFRNGRQEQPELLLALQRQLNQVRAFYDVHVTLDAAGAPGINDRLAAEVFQIVTEGVSNICKHTRARSAQVLLAQEGGQLVIDIANPADGHAYKEAFAPRSIAQRVDALGGTLVIDAGAGQTVLRVRVPI